MSLEGLANVYYTVQRGITITIFAVSEPTFFCRCHVWSPVLAMNIIINRPREGMLHAAVFASQHFLRTIFYGHDTKKGGGYYCLSGLFWLFMHKLRLRRKEEETEKELCKPARTRHPAFPNFF